MTDHAPRKVIGYARVSADDQVAHDQVDALRQAGVTEVVLEQASGVVERPLLDSLVPSLSADEGLVVTEVSLASAWQSRQRAALRVKLGLG